MWTAIDYEKEKSREEGRIEAEREIEQVAYYLKEGKDDKSISDLLKIPVENIKKYRKILSIML